MMIAMVDQDYRVSYTKVNSINRADKALHDIAEKYFDDNPDKSEYSVCLVDFENHTSTIYLFKITHTSTISYTLY